MAKKAAKTKDPAKAARELALAGNDQAAIAALTPQADGGSASASASLAELLAFSGEWARLIPYAARLVAEPTAVYAANVFDDMVRLLGRAGRETGEWKAIQAAIAPALAAAKKEKVPAHVPRRHEVILSALDAYCARKGKAPHELVALWDDASEPQSKEQRRASYRNAVDNVLTIKPKLKKDPDGLARHLFALAVTFDQPDEIVRLYPEREDLRSFDHACAYARAVGDERKAWAALEKKLSDWYPVDQAQVAPVDPLLVDPALEAVVTPKRALVVLRTPRAGR